MKNNNLKNNNFTVSSYYNNFIDNKLRIVDHKLSQLDRLSQLELILMLIIRKIKFECAHSKKRKFTNDSKGKATVYILTYRDLDKFYVGLA